MLCAVLTDDVMFSQMVANALPEDCSVRPVNSQRAADKALDNSVKFLIVDLSQRIDAPDLVRLAKSFQIRVIGVASHVHVGKIEAAQDAGFDTVLTRGQVAEKLSTVVSQPGQGSTPD